MFLRACSFSLLAALAACSDGAAPPLSTQSDTIIGGVRDPGHPYVVGVGSQNFSSCTGTLISRRTVITAGHCIGGMSHVHFGAVGTNTVKVAQEIRHPDYQETSDGILHDLGILRLQSDAPTQPAPLLREVLTNTPAFIGPAFTFVGYGTAETEYGKKRVVTFPIAKIGPADINGGFVQKINETEFYYALPTANTCQGDSGGPAFVVRGGVERHAGTTSWGDDDCEIDGVQSRTDQPAIDGFIQQYIDQFEGASNACRANGVCDESCNNKGGDQQVWDPDCQQAHCGADGLCALACALPVDPDCTGVDHCMKDGMCDPACENGDVDDCANLGGGDIDAGLPDAGLPDAAPPDAAIDAGLPDADLPDAEPVTQPDAGDTDTNGDDGCGCRTGGAPRATWTGGLLLLGLLAFGLRRRSRR
jgi:MYXO-CTERM domain-containing protein